MIFASRILTIAASAILLNLAAPPFNLWPLAWIALIPLYFVIGQASVLQAAGWAWLMGTVALLGACSWWMPLLQDFAHLSWGWSVLIWFALCGYQALTYALWGGVCRWLHRRFGLSWLVSGPLVIVLAESLLPFLFKYYLGIVLWRTWPLTQVAEVGGVAAVSAFMVLGNLILAQLLEAIRQKRKPTRGVMIALGIFILIGLGGWLRALQVTASRAEAPPLKVGLVQPNFGIVSLKEREQRGKVYVKALREATVALANQGAELIVWPESSWPYLFDRQIEREYPPGHPWELRPGAKGRLLLGALTHTFGSQEIYNSALLIGESGHISGRYDKHALVPFAEYIPWAEKYPERTKRLREQLPEWPDIVPGSSPRVLEDNGLRIGLLICSEDIDRDLAHAVAHQNPHFLVSIVSDAWFGDSAAPEQHLALSTFRAIETRRDFVRATNTGVSALVDASGRILKESTLVAVTPDQPQPAELLLGEIALLQSFALGPYSIKFFPYLCFILLLAAIASKKHKGRLRRT